MRPRISLILFAALAAGLLVSACDQRPADPALPVIDITWSPITSFSGEFPIASIWGSGPDNIYAGQSGVTGHGDVFAVGDPAVWRYNGNSWSVVDVPIGDENGNPSIWGSGDSDLYIAIDKLHHFNGSTWSVEPVDAQWVTGVSETQVYAAGHFAVFEFNGVEWDTLRTMTGVSVRGLSAAPDGSLFMSASGTISIWNGTSWTDTTLPEDCPYDVKAFAVDVAFAIGECRNQIYRWDGVSWTAQVNGPDELRALGGSSGTDVFAVGRYGLVFRYDGISWQKLPRPTALDLNAIALAGSEVVVAGDSFSAASWNGSDWRRLHDAVPGLPYRMFAESPARLMVLDGWSIFKFENKRWVETQLPDGYAGAIGGSSLDDVFASTSAGMFHYDGASWSLSDSLATRQNAFWQSPGGTLFSVGETSAYRHDGNWVRIYDGDVRFREVAGDGEKIVVLGDKGFDDRHAVVLRFDGTEWVELPPPADYVNSVWVGPGMDIYLAGYGGLYRWNGERFRRLSPQAGFVGFRSVFGVGNGVVALGEREAGYFDGSLFNLVETSETFLAIRANDGSLISATHAGLASWRP